MIYIKSIGYIIVSTVLALFIALTLSVFGGNAFKVICSVCTVGILICLMFNFAFNTVKADKKRERAENKKINKLRPISIGITASAPALVSWIILLLSHNGYGANDFYRWHKIINGCFIQIYNLMNSDVISSALSIPQLIIMLLLAFIPMISFITVYFAAYCGIIKD